MHEVFGRIMALAIKPQHYADMRAVSEARVTLAGIEGDAWTTSPRRVTLLFSEQWEDVQRELSARIPWHARRANVLVSGIHPRDIIKRRIRLGQAELKIHGETRPCGRMDQAHPSLQAALKRDLRGGVYGSVLQEGRIALGDTVEIIVES